MERLHRKVIVFLAAPMAAVVVMLAAGGQPALSATRGSVLVSPLEFQTTTELWPFVRTGAELMGEGTFTARLKIPAGASATAVEVYYWDAATSELCVEHVAEVKSSDPAPTWRDLSGRVCSSGSVAETRTLVVPLESNRILASEVLYITVGIATFSSNMKLHGAKVRYRRP